MLQVPLYPLTLPPPSPPLPRPGYKICTTWRNALCNCRRVFLCKETFFHTFYWQFPITYYSFCILQIPANYRSMRWEKRPHTTQKTHHTLNNSNTYNTTQMRTKTVGRHLWNISPDVEEIYKNTAKLHPASFLVAKFPCCIDTYFSVFNLILSLF